MLSASAGCQLALFFSAASQAYRVHAKNDVAYGVNRNTGCQPEVVEYCLPLGRPKGQDWLRAYDNAEPLGQRLPAQLLHRGKIKNEMDKGRWIFQFL